MSKVKMKVIVIVPEGITTVDNPNWVFIEKGTGEESTSRATAFRKVVLKLRKGKQLTMLEHLRRVAYTLTADTIIIN